jgi:agmatine deiminase
MQRRIPAEWEPHQATLLAFPHEGRDWPGKFPAVQWAFVEFIRKVSQQEPVVLLVKDEAHWERVQTMLTKAYVDLERISPLPGDTNRSWMRDSGPIIVKQANGKREALQFGFTAWAKYRNYRKDQLIPSRVASHLGLPLTPVTHHGKPVVLEGGAIDYNGQGTLITTEECLLHPTIQVRNPGFGKAEYEAVFAEYLGIQQTIWLGEGIAGDDTHGHVDDICRFVNPHTVVACVEANSADPNHARLEDNLRRLREVRLPDGQALTVIPVPMPHRLDFDGLRLPASYVNFLILNEAVLVPTFNDPHDYLALGIIREVFPNRTVIGIHAVDLVWGLGTLHCLSHEIPA